MTILAFGKGSVWRDYYLVVVTQLTFDPFVLNYVPKTGIKLFKLLFYTLHVYIHM